MNEQRTEPTSTAELAYGRSENPDDAAKRPVDNNGADATHTPLVPAGQGEEYSKRWQAVQAEFVDEPQQAVKDADGLVAEVIQTLARNFADQRQGLEDQWSRGTEVSTEDLRQALMQYRTFFQRLLAA